MEKKIKFKKLNWKLQNASKERYVANYFESVFFVELNKRPKRISETEFEKEYFASFVHEVEFNNYLMGSPHSGYGLGLHNSLEDAMSACQEHFENVILEWIDSEDENETP